MRGGILLCQNTLKWERNEMYVVKRIAVVEHRFLMDDTQTHSVVSFLHVYLNRQSISTLEQDD